MKMLIRAALVLIAVAPATVFADKRVDDAVARAESQLKSGKPEEAVKTMQKVAGQVPGAESQAALARIQEKAGLLDEAAASATLAGLDLTRGSSADALKHAQDAVQAQSNGMTLAVLARAGPGGQRGG